MSINGRIKKLEQQVQLVPRVIFRIRRLIAEGKITKHQIATRWPNVAREWL